MGTTADAAARGVPATRRRKPLWRRVWQERWAYVFIAPPIIGFLVFLGYPAIFAFYSSFFKFNHFAFEPLEHPLANYTRALKDGMFWRSFLNVLELFLISFVGGQVLSLFLAVLINSVKRFEGLFRTLYYIPIVTSVVIVSTIFRWFLRSDAAGIFNLVLKSLTGLGPIRWLQEDILVIPSISMVSIWTAVGGSIIIWTAGLKSIPPELYEAATIDGATRWQQFWKVTLPMLKPIVMYQAVLGFIGGMKAFALNFVMTPAGDRAGVPLVAAMTPVLMVYHYGFQRLHMGYASAVAYLLSTVILLISILQFKLFGSAETYD